ncbi:MAG: helix-turn-helix transcriptional regulator, partial [Clostridia bacterium]|nr:helix-turn-helix transcriptional regulator [Clostridia bacterium]
TPYTISPDIHEGCVYAYFTISGGKSQKYIDKLGIHEPFKIYRVDNFAKIAEVFYEIIEASQDTIKNDIYMESAFLRILSHSNPLETDGEKNQKSIYSKRIEDAIRYIAKNYDNTNLRLADIADHLKINEQYLSKQFKKEVGVALYQYITNTRMDAAISLLTSSNYNMNQISEYVGYNDHQAFHALFKKRFGVTPSEYKKNNHNDG